MFTNLSDDRIKIYAGTTNQDLLSSFIIDKKHL